MGVFKTLNLSHVLKAEKQGASSSGERWRINKGRANRGEGAVDQRVLKKASTSVFVLGSTQFVFFGCFWLCCS